MKYRNYGLFIVLLFLLTGCVKGDVNIEFSNGKKANMDVEILFPENFFSSYNTSINELKNKLNENGLQDWKSEELKESINGVTYLGLKVIAPENINKSLISFVKIDDNEKNFQVEIDMNAVNELYNTSELKDINNYSLSNLKTMGLDLDLNITMPGMIKETNLGDIDDNIVKINLLDLLTQDKISSISIISTNEQKNNFPVNSLIIISLLVILYYIIRKSK
ncbi:hypothetical protein [Thomasclavelia cocleata]|jgi:hypothetical protein|uniref:hypothetical protein n=1 Tax=Thomasclavelia cocleata TaxID=69824 RepID=UPI002432CEFC|nr:hypothetical protein [Thomasclavelia cocleata]MCI9630283.1 hypothetical protein [Thomasclavelia cocleata]